MSFQVGDIVRVNGCSGTFKLENYKIAQDLWETRSSLDGGLYNFSPVNLILVSSGTIQPTAQNVAIGCQPAVGDILVDNTGLVPKYYTVLGIDLQSVPRCYYLQDQNTKIRFTTPSILNCTNLGPLSTIPSLPIGTQSTLSHPQLQPTGLFEPTIRKYSECQHIWKDYVGLQESFTYCVECDLKRNQ